MNFNQSNTDLAGCFERLEAKDGDFPGLTFRYLPLHRLSGWDLRYEHGLEEMIYMQNMIDEDDTGN